MLLACLLLVVAGALLVDYGRRATLFSAFGLLHRAQDLTVLAGLVWSAATIGARGLRLLATRANSRLFQALLELGLGFIVHYVVAMMLALVQAFNAVTLGAALVAPLVLLRRDAFETARNACALLPRSITFSPTSLVMSALVVLYTIMALAPPREIDPLTYHLVVPRDYLAHGGAGRFYDNAFHSAPPAMSMLYAYLMALSSDVAPQLLHAFFGLMLVLLLYDRARAFWSQPIAVWASVIFAAQWSMQHAIQRANVDLHFAFYALASFVLLLESWGDRTETLSVRWAALSGAMIGAAASSKVQAVSSVVGSEAMLAVLLVRRQITWRAVLLFHAAAFAVYLPTLVRNLLFSIDVFIATIAGIFGGNFGADPQELLRLRLFSEWKRLFMVELTPLTALLTPLLLYTAGSFPSTNFDAYIDPFYLVSVAACVLLVRTDRRLGGALIYLGSFYLVWLATAGLTRYAFPVLPLLAVFTAYTFDWFSANAERFGRTLRRGFSAIVLGFAMISAGAMAVSERSLLGANAAAFFEIMNRVDYLRVTTPGVIDTLAAATFMNERDVERDNAVSPEANRVYMVFDSQGYYLNRRYYNDPWYVNLLLLERAERAGKNPITWLRAQSYRYVLLDHSRIPWMRNETKASLLLNPYPDALARLEAMLRYWVKHIEPRLEFKKQMGRLRVYEVPDE